MIISQLYSRLGDLGLALIKAAPVLVPIYCVLLGALHAIPVRNPNANLERLALLQQQLAFFTTLDGFLIYSLTRDALVRRWRA